MAARKSSRRVGDWWNKLLDVPGGSSDRPTYGGSASTSGAREPIGVPEGYTVPYTRDMTGMSARAAEGWAAGSGGHGSIQERGPRYMEGDEWGPGALGPIGIAELQEHMAASGLLGDQWRRGIWDESSRNAYKAVLTEANAMGLTAQQVIQLRGQSVTFAGSGGGSGSGGGGGGGQWTYDEDGNPIFVEEQYVPPPLELRTTNRDDLIRALRTGVIDEMGVGWNREQIGSLADQYIAMERQVQVDAYNQRIGMERQEFEQPGSTSGEVISTVDIESPDTFLENQLIERDPVGYQTGQIINEAIPNFMSMLRGWTG